MKRLLTVSTLALLASCYDGTFLDGFPCNKDEDCGPDLACVSGICGERTAPGCAEEVPFVELGGELPVDSGLLPEPPDTSHLAGTCGGEGASEVALRWRAPKTGGFVVVPELDPAFFEAGLPEPVIHVHRNACDGAELSCGSERSGSRAFQAAENDTVVIVADGLSPGLAYGAAGFHLRIEEDGYCLGPDPEITAQTLPFMFTGQTRGEPDRVRASLCSPERVGYVGGMTSGVGIGPDRAYRWQAPHSETYAFEIVSANFDPALYVLADGCGGQRLACVDDTSTSDQQITLLPKVTARLEAGQEAVIVVDSIGEGGEFTMRVREAFDCVPEHEDTVELTRTTKELEVDLDDAIEIDLGGVPYSGVLYRLSAGVEGMYTFDVNPFFLFPSCAGGVRQSPSETGLWLPAPAGLELLMLVYEPDEDELPPDGIVSITWSQSNCPEAVLEGELPIEHSGTTEGGGDSFMSSALFEECTGTGTNIAFGWAMPDVAHGFRAPATGRYVVTAESDAFDAGLYAYETSCTGRYLACDNDGGGGTSARLELDLLADQEVVLVVDAADEAVWDEEEGGATPVAGPYTLTVDRLE